MRSTLDLTSTFNSPRTVDHRGNIEPPTLSTYLLYLGLVRDVDVDRLIQSIPTSKRIGIVPSHCRHVLVLVLVLSAARTRYVRHHYTLGVRGDPADKYGTHSHRSFVRGRAMLARGVTRLRTAGTGVRTPITGANRIAGSIEYDMVYGIRHSTYDVRHALRVNRVREDRRGAAISDREEDHVHVLILQGHRGTHTRTRAWTMRYSCRACRRGMGRTRSSRAEVRRG